jgi:hypothetical protein
VFADGTTWNAPENASWHALPKQQSLGDIMEPQLVEQYQRETCRNADYILLDHEDLWLCTCGNINHNTEETCYCCKNNKAVLLDTLNEENLAQHNTEYIAEQQEIANKLKQENEERSKKIKKGVIIGSIAVVLAFVILLFTVILPAQKKKQQEEQLNTIKSSAYSEICNIAKEVLDGHYYENEILRSIVVTYHSEEIEGNRFNIHVTYGISWNLDGDYSYFSYILSGELGDETFNMKRTDSPLQKEAAQTEPPLVEEPMCVDDPA